MEEEKPQAAQASGGPVPPPWWRDKTFLGAIALAMLVAGLFRWFDLWAWFDQAMPRPEGPALPPPPVIMGSPALAAPPVRDALLLAMAAIPTFLAVLTCHVDVVEPVKMAFTWWRTRAAKPVPLPARQWLATALAPAVGQPALRAGVLVAGMVGIALWHMGTDAFAVLRSLMMAGAMMTLMIGIMAAFVLARPMGMVRAMLNAVAAYVMFGLAMDAAEWGFALVAAAGMTTLG